MTPAEQIRAALLSVPGHQGWAKKVDAALAALAGLEAALASRDDRVWLTRDEADNARAFLRGCTSPTARRLLALLDERIGDSND